MSFALPTAFFFAALAIPIVAFYILKVRLRRMPISTNLFWKQIFDEKPPRSLWRNLRHLLSLVAQLALLTLLVLAIADPRLPWHAKQAQRTVLVLDNSASMRSTDVAPNRFAAAQDRALQFLAGVRAQDEVAILMAGPKPEVLVGMTGHLPTLRRAIHDATQSDRGSDLAAAISLGQQLVGDHPNGRVIVFSDGCDDGVAASPEKAEADASPNPPQAADDEAAETPADIVHWEIIGDKTASNVGITQFQVRRSLIDPLGYEILTAVTNATDQSVRGRLEITLDEAPIDVIPLKLAPGEHWNRSLEKTSIDGGVLQANLTKLAIDAEDEADEPAAEPTPINQLATDDEAWAYLPPQKRRDVLIVSPGNLFLRKVFEANPLVNLQVTNELPTTWPKDALIVLHELIPEQLPPGDLLIIDPTTDTDLWSLKGTLQNPIITDQAEQSPLLTHIRLDNVLVPAAQKIELKAPATALVSTVSGEAIFSEIKRAEGRCLLLSVGLDSSDLAFRTAFPILIANSLSWFAREDAQSQPAIGVDQVIFFDLAPDQQGADGHVQLASPAGPIADDGELRPLDSSTLDVQRYAIGPFRQTGLWQLQSVDASAETDSSDEAPPQLLRLIAVNLSSERETDLRPPTWLQEQATSNPAIASSWNRPLWFYLLCIAVAFTAWEWFIYQRRVIT